MNSSDENAFASSQLSGESLYDWAWIGAQCAEGAWFWVTEAATNMKPVVAPGAYYNFENDTPGTCC
jgi:hypothetical protein